MSILPSFLISELTKASNTTAAAVATVQEIPREYGVDFKTGRLTGRIVEGIEAIKVWVWNCLHSERYRYALYSWQYGVEYEQYIGETITDEYLQSDCQTETEEALLESPYITGISDFEASIDDSGATLHLTFTVNTTLGDMEVDENV